MYHLMAFMEFVDKPRDKLIVPYMYDINLCNVSSCLDLEVYFVPFIG